MKTLFDFSRPDPAREESVPIGESVIRNWPLVVMTVKEAFEKSEKTVLLLTSNGREDRHATEWYLRRVVR